MRCRCSPPPAGFGLARAGSDVILTAIEMSSSRFLARSVRFSASAAAATIPAVTPSHAFRTPGVSWAGKTVFGRRCHCLLALGSGLGLVGTASSRR